MDALKDHTALEAQALLAKILAHGRPYDLLEAAYSTRDMLQSTAARHGATPPEGLAHLVRTTTDLSRMMNLAAQANLPAEALTTLAHRERTRSRYEADLDLILAVNSKLTAGDIKGILDRGCFDSTNVLLSLAVHPAVTSPLLADIVVLGGAFMAEHILPSLLLEEEDLDSVGYHPSYLKGLEPRWKGLPEWEEIKSLGSNWTGTIRGLKDAAQLVRR